MFKTVITRQAANRVQLHSGTLVRSKVKAKQTAHIVDVKSKRALSNPLVILGIFAIGCYIGSKKSVATDKTFKIPVEKRIDAEENNEAIVLRETGSRSKLLISLIGSAISVVSMVSRVTRVKKNMIESAENPHDHPDGEAL